MHNINILRVQSYQRGTEVFEFTFKKYVDWQFPIGFMPPSFTTFQKPHFVLGQHQSTIIIEADHIGILILDNSNKLQIALSYKA
jgi:hypothetical protein